MKRNWSSDELLEHFTILETEFSAIEKISVSSRLGFLVILKYFQIEARFPVKTDEIPRILIEYIAKQLKIDPSAFKRYKLQGRTYQRHQKQIREHFGFKEATSKDQISITQWLTKNTKWYDKEKVRSDIYARFRALKFEPSTKEQINRLVDSITHTGEQLFFKSIFDNLSKNTKDCIDQLLESLIKNQDDDKTITFNKLRSDPGRIGLESIFKETEKLKIIRELNIPKGLFSSLPNSLIKKYKLRVASELLGELRAHPDEVRYPLLSIFFWSRSQEITDNLVELLIQIIHKINSNAENRVVKEYVKEFKKVKGKNTILLKIAESALEFPDEKIRDVIYPIAKENTLIDLVKELKKNGDTFKEKVFSVIKRSYSRHYRKMIPEILEILSFRSNNETHKPVIEALKIVKKHINSKTKYLEIDSTFPIIGVIKLGWKNPIIQKDDDGNYFIEKAEYEIYALQALREKLRCKEIWLVGAKKYRNPEQDLPQDFEERRSEYYESLNQPEDPEPFINDLKQAMEKALLKFNKSIVNDPDVRIDSRKSGRIILTPYEKQPDPENIKSLKKEIFNSWSMVDLLDILKEADLRINFTDTLKSSAEREILDPELKRKRLLMILFGLGTNTGLKRIANATEQSMSFDNLRYLKRKYINKDNLRKANISIINAIHKAKTEDIWGELGTSSCASDSKKFGAWDQNLMTEWHIRYRGKGVMIYWHVEKKSTCIYSQLKSCSSSEVSAMIEGVIKHCTDLNIDRNYVDTHGQSEVAFAFSHMLNFSLMPRFKSLSKKKLYIPNNTIKNELTNLKPILTKSIDWNLIKEQYDQIIKYTTALKLGTASAEAIMKRFTRNNLQHPTYKALQELGKVIKTIFLCEYLTSKKLRIEINQGLNVIENWNSANGFIFYGKAGEISTNNIEDQEVSVLSLQLLQNCLVYINTLMIQDVLAKPKWDGVLTKEDQRALSPLFYNYINPYGKFELNMNERIMLNTS